MFDFASHHRFSTKVRAPIDEYDDTNEGDTNQRAQKVPKEISKTRKIFNLVCGIEETDDQETASISLEQKAAEAAEFLHEDKTFKR